MKRKGQMKQVFVYMVAAFVFAIIIFFGYKSITGFMEKGEELAFIDFKTDIEGAIQRISSDYGSVVVYNQRNPITIPRKYEEICFVDLDANLDPKASPICDSSSEEFRPIICDSWRDDRAEQPGWHIGNTNVFLEPIGLYPINVYKMEIKKGYLCIPIIDGRIDFKVEGMGDKTRVFV